MEENEKREMEKKRTRLVEAKNRLQDLEKFMCRIYEDMILNKIPANRYEILNNQYETEQGNLSIEIRKANGKQQEYEKRYKARREQKKQEKLKVLKRAGIPLCEM